MRPIPIPDPYLAAWQIHEPGAYRRVLAAPSGDLLDTEVAPLEVIWRPAPYQGTRIVAATSLWVPEPDEVAAALDLGGAVALTVISTIHPPVQLNILDPGDAPH